MKISILKSHQGEASNSTNINLSSRKLIVLLVRIKKVRILKVSRFFPLQEMKLNKPTNQPGENPNPTESRGIYLTFKRLYLSEQFTGILIM